MSLNPISPTSPTSPAICKGFIMAHLHPDHRPSPDSPAINPYAVVPCPHDPTIPKILSVRCKESTGARACWRNKYCEMHWCGGCKKVSGVRRGANQGGDDQGGDAAAEVAVAEDAGEK